MKRFDDTREARNTSPDALMDLRLRFSTAYGARTITASKIPLRDASLIAEAMRAAGHEAAILDHQGSNKRVRALVRALNRKSSRNKPCEVIFLPSKEKTNGHVQISKSKRS